MADKKGPALQMKDREQVRTDCPEYRDQERAHTTV